MEVEGERERGEENCVPTCSVIKRNIDSTPVYRVIHIHGGWRLCLFASVVPSAFSPYCCCLIHTIYVSLPYQLRSSLLSLSHFSLLLLLGWVYIAVSLSLSLRSSPLRFNPKRESRETRLASLLSFLRIRMHQTYASNEECMRTCKRCRLHLVLATSRR